MTEAEAVFKQTNAERKRNGYGARHKKGQGGKIVKLPSDTLTRKERNAMNGECVSYELNKPMPWRAFKQMPRDIQIEYIQSLRNRYKVRTPQLAKMFGINDNTLSSYFREIGVGVRAGGSYGKIDMDGWKEFCGEQDFAKEEKMETSKTDNITTIIAALKGTGAKLTIEVTL